MVSSCFCLVLSLLVNLIEAKISPSVFHLFLHVVAIPAHSRMLSVFVMWLMSMAAYSKPMFAMLCLRYFSLFLSAFFAFLDAGLSSMFPDSFLCADSSCF